MCPPVNITLNSMASGHGLSNANMSQPLFSFGIIADIQYADIANGHSFLGIPRYYRHSFKVLQRAVSKWNNVRNLRFSINLGDTIDGFCPKDQSLTAVHKVIKEFERLNRPVYHIIGNHCLYNFVRSKLISLFNIPSMHSCAYYDFSPVPEYRFVVLDAYDISAIGWPGDHPKTAAALKFLEANNPNVNKNSPEGMVGLEKRFVMFNGAVGKEQLDWLDGVLQDSTKKMQKVVICSHVPLYPGAAGPEGLLWNYEEVLEMIHQYECVKVCFAGHDHKGGYAIDPRGVHHRTLEAALECPEGSNAFGCVHVFHDRVFLSGTDRMPSTEMVFSS